MRIRFLAGILSFFIFSLKVQASAFSENFGLLASGSLEAGRIGSDDAGLKDRWMNAFSVDALGGYQLGRLLIGLHGDYRLQGQMTSLSGAGGTNLKGDAFLLGLGAGYRFSEKFYGMAALDLLGKYNFGQDTQDGNSDELRSPIGLRAKFGYFFTERFPLTLDFDMQYLQFQKFHVGGVDNGWKTNQWMAGAGLTYHFGATGRTTASAAQVSEPVPAATPAPAPAEAAEQKPAPASPNFETIVLQFAPYGTSLSGEAQETLRKAAAALAGRPAVRIRVEGHSDTSGEPTRNINLSKKRAESVRAFLVKNGVAKDRITVVGLGSSRPVADNEEKSGRATNRRVEIHLETAGE